MKYGKVSLSDTVTDKDNEDQPRDENGKFLPVEADVSSTVNEDQDFPSSLYSTSLSIGLPTTIASAILKIPASGALFAAFLGINPVASLPVSMLSHIPPATLKTLTSLTFFPNVIGSSFMTGLKDSLYVAIVLTAIGALLSAFRGGRYVHGEVTKKKDKAGKGIPLDPSGENVTISSESKK
jgi:hypothetical protein